MTFLPPMKLEPLDSAVRPDPPFFWTNQTPLPTRKVKCREMWESQSSGPGSKNNVYIFPTKKRCKVLKVCDKQTWLTVIVTSACLNHKVTQPLYAKMQEWYLKLKHAVLLE